MPEIKIISPTEYMKYYFSGYQVSLPLPEECKGGIKEFLDRANLKQYEPVYKLGFIVASGNWFTAHLFKEGEKQIV